MHDTKIRDFAKLCFRTTPLSGGTAITVTPHGYTTKCIFYKYNAAAMNEARYILGNCPRVVAQDKYLKSADSFNRTFVLVSPCRIALNTNERKFLEVGSTPNYFGAVGIHQTEPL